MVRTVVIAALCAVARAASNDAPVPFAEFAAPADKADGSEGRMQQMFQDVRRLQYSYDFASTCVSSLMACIADSDCADDEECNARRRTRKSRRLSAACPPRPPPVIRPRRLPPLPVYPRYTD